jgi:hypothetical protein
MTQPETPEAKTEQPIAPGLQMIGTDTEAGRCIDDVCDVPSSPA